MNFLDVTLDLNTGIYKPFIKENDTPLYVNIKSNHPPTVLKNIPEGINNRLSRISANKTVFDAATPVFQEALTRSGYLFTLKYDPPTVLTTQKKKKCRTKPVTWFNPPFSKNVKTNIGKEFLKLLDTAFPPSNPLHRLFTRHTVKISYRRMPNMAQALSRHNSKILNEDIQQPQQTLVCNCRGGQANCPVGGKCRTESVVYRATVRETVSGKTETYTGLTGREFKERWYEHRTDMNNTTKKKTTRLSAHTRLLKEKSKNFTVDWRILEKAKPYNPISKKCMLCLKEKFYIMYHRDGSTLNKRSEVFNTCLHRKDKLLENFET